MAGIQKKSRGHGLKVQKQHLLHRAPHLGAEKRSTCRELIYFYFNYDEKAIAPKYFFIPEAVSRAGSVGLQGRRLRRERLAPVQQF